MLRNKIKKWASVKFVITTLSLFSFIFITLAPSASALSIGDTTVATAAPALTCSVDFFNPLTYLECPIIDGLNGIINYFDGFINGQLNINGCTYLNAKEGVNTFANCTKSGAQNNAASNGFYAAWSELRNVAVGLLAITALVMVISQALGFEAFDAYTIKKVLPRILIAAIGISLSWQMAQFLVQLSNDLGNGVANLIYAPFLKTAQGGNIIVNQTTGLAGFTAVMVTGFATLISPIAAILILSIAVLAVLLGFIVIVLRQVLIIFLAIFAPIAIVAFVLPSTQKVWKMWWTNFMKALIMFPLIAGLIAIGRVFALVSIQTGGTTGQLFAFVAYFGPYFFIPQMFKFAGGVLAAASNIAAKAQKSYSKFATSQAKQSVGKSWDQLSKDQKYTAKTWQNKLFRRATSKIPKYNNKGEGYDLGRVMQTPTLLNKAGLSLSKEGRSLENIKNNLESERRIRHDGGLEDASKDPYLNDIAQNNVEAGAAIDMINGVDTETVRSNLRSSGSFAKIGADGKPMFTFDSNGNKVFDADEAKIESAISRIKLGLSNKTGISDATTKRFLTLKWAGLKGGTIPEEIKDIDGNLDVAATEKHQAKGGATVMRVEVIRKGFVDKDGNYNPADEANMTNNLIAAEKASGDTFSAEAGWGAHNKLVKSVLAAYKAFPEDTYPDSPERDALLLQARKDFSKAAVTGAADPYQGLKTASKDGLAIEATHLKYVIEAQNALPTDTPEQIDKKRAVQLEVLGLMEALDALRRNSSIMASSGLTGVLTADNMDIPGQPNTPPPAPTSAAGGRLWIPGQPNTPPPAPTNNAPSTPQTPSRQRIITPQTPGSVVNNTTVNVTSTVKSAQEHMDAFQTDSLYRKLRGRLMGMVDERLEEERRSGMGGGGPDEGQH
jgi:hypothetical protein